MAGDSELFAALKRKYGFSVARELVPDGGLTRYRIEMPYGDDLVVAFRTRPRRTDAECETDVVDWFVSGSESDLGPVKVWPEAFGASSREELELTLAAEGS